MWVITEPISFTSLVLKVDWLDFKDVRSTRLMTRLFTGQSTWLRRQTIDSIDFGVYLTLSTFLVTIALFSSRTAHRAKIELLKKETPAFIDPSLWPPNSPDLNPLDYCVWGILQERVYHDKIADVTEKKMHREWVALDSDIVTNATSQWRRQLRACVHAPADISNSSCSKTSAWNWNNALDDTRHCFTASCVQSDNLS